MVKCKNCVNGKVLGGFERKRTRELEGLRKDFEFAISCLSRKDTQHYEAEKRRLYEEYRDKAGKKSRESPRKVGICAYCGGLGVVWR